MFRQLSILSLFLICCCNLTLSQQQHPLRPLPSIIQSALALHMHATYWFLSQLTIQFQGPLINIACGRQSILRTTGLVRPTGNQQLPTTCTYTIIANNFFVCQMRLDFVRFSLPQPTVDTTTPFDAYPACNDGHLQVGNIKLCGENTGQHSKRDFFPDKSKNHHLKFFRLFHLFAQFTIPSIQRTQPTELWQSPSLQMEMQPQAIGK